YAHTTVGALVYKVVLDSEIIGEECGYGRISGEEVAVLKKIVVLNGYVLWNSLSAVGKFLLIRTSTCLAYPLLFRVVFIHLLQVTYGNSSAACMRDIIAYDTAIVNIVFKMYSEITGKLDSAIYKINIVS